jgi:hypothetical protein
MDVHLKKKWTNKKDLRMFFHSSLGFQECWSH